MPRYYLSTTRMTVGVRTSKGLIVEAAPIVQKFIGQPLQNLVLWMKRQPGFQMHKYPDPKPRVHSQ